MTYLSENSEIALAFLAYAVGMGALVWMYLKPPKDPPPSAKADSSLALTTCGAAGPA